MKKEDVEKLKSLLISWEDENMSDYEYCNAVGRILGVGKWTWKGVEKNKK
jgi:hypothetical protein